MKFFIDTAKVEDIKKANDMGVICGVTTNPSLIAKEGRVFEEVIAEIASIVDGPISGEVKATTVDAEGMIAEGRAIAKIHPNMVVKIPMTVEGLKACKNEKSRQKYRDEHDSDFIILNVAKRYFDFKGLKKLPSHKALQAEVEQLIKEKNELYNQYQTAREEVQRLDTIRHNLEQHLGRKIGHKQEQER